jgi:hypothetical protein
MGPKRKLDKKSTSPTGRGASSSAGKTAGGGSSAGAGNKTEIDLPPSAGYLISCDVPTKQFIQHLNDLKPVDKKFILEDLDAEHLLVKATSRNEIDSKVETWMDENVFSAIERVGENLDMS